MKVEEGQLKFESSFSVCVNSCYCLFVLKVGTGPVISNLELTSSMCLCQNSCNCLFVLKVGAESSQV